MEIDFKKASFKDFEKIPGMDVMERSREFDRYLNYLDSEEHLNYRMEILSGCGPEVLVRTKAHPNGLKVVSLVSNDYWGLTQHPEMIAAAVNGIKQFGTGSAASPAIGGHFSFHQTLEEKIAKFFKRESAMTYTTGYTANSATLQCLLKEDDLAILDMEVHASVYEGCQLCKVKRFPHNNLQELERILKVSQSQYRSRMVVIDGVYSQNGDLAPLPEISKLCKQYGAYLVVDDAHGTGVIGATGRGLIELHDMFQAVDIITGTFSKTFGHIGGYVVSNPELIRFLKFQSRQHLFSVTASPASACILRSIELLDEEPYWKDKLWDNIKYLKNGLESLGLNLGETSSAIIPVKVGDAWLTGEAGKLLLSAGVYANPIIYPAVSKKDARIRTSVMATHSYEQLDKVLNAFEWVDNKLGLSKMKLA